MDTSRIAIKQLTASDLSFFEGHLKLSKQKAINLNRDVFVDDFFPGLTGSSESIHLTLTIIGPGGSLPYPISRKILRTKGAKNWRLNGEIVRNPEDAPDRFEKLESGDLAVLSFEGKDRPNGLILILISQAEDGNLHSLLTSNAQLLGRQSMASVSLSDIDTWRMATQNEYLEFHPFEVLTQPDTIEDALFGERDDLVVLPRRTPGRLIPLTTEQLQKQLLVAHETGLNGEELFHSWLLLDHKDQQIDWISATYARSPYDFKIQNPNWAQSESEVYVDVKTTKGDWDREFHVSLSELRFAAASTSYWVARIYGYEGSEPRMKLLSGLSEIAQRTLAHAGKFPDDVVAESFRINANLLQVDLEADLPPLRDDG
ncbi:MAG: DUF3883 domain-containing protein [Caldilineaceae bacterium]